MATMSFPAEIGMISDRLKESDDPRVTWGDPKGLAWSNLPTTCTNQYQHLYRETDWPKNGKGDKVKESPIQKSIIQNDS